MQMKNRLILILACLSLNTQQSKSFTPTAALAARIKFAKIQNNVPELNLSAENKNADASPSSTPEHTLFDPEYRKVSKEIEWLLRITSKIIGPSLDSAPLGELPLSTIRKCPLIMRAWMKRCSEPHSNAAHVVESLLDRLIDEREHGNAGIEKEAVLCTNVYNIAIESWAKTSGKEFKVSKTNPGCELVSLLGTNENWNSKREGHDFAAKRASEILHKMEKSTDIRPSEKSYNLVIKALVKSREPDAVEEIERILDRMNAYTSEDDGYLRPLIESYNYYLYALANRKSTNTKQDADKATDLLNNLKARGSQHGGSRPDVNTYNQVISILAKTKSASGAMQAQRIFDDMAKEANATGVYACTDTFNALMNCWLKIGPKRGRSHIERLLSTMVDLRSHGHDYASPDRVSVNTAISAVAKSYRKDSVKRVSFMLLNMEKTYGVLPDTTSYNLVIDAYAKSRDFQGGRKAMNLLSQMEDLYRHGHLELIPDSFSYSTVINAMAIRPDTGKLADSLLGRMNQLHQSHDGNIPDTVVYNSVMNVYSTQGDNESVLRNIAILNYMEDSYIAGNSNVKPSIISFNTVLKTFAYARDDFTREAEELLARMEERKFDILPDVISYTSVVSSYARSDVPGKAKAAQQILNRMVDAHKAGNKGAKPTIFTFNAVLNACAFTFDQKEKVDAFIVAVSTLVIIPKFAKPDHTTYGTLLKAWCNLIPKDDDRRTRAVNSVFRQCCRDGQVGSMVLQQLKYAASPELYRTLIGKDITVEVNISNFPPQWSRNVKERNGKGSKKAGKLL